MTPLDSSGEPEMTATLGYRLIRAAGVVHQHFSKTLAECGLTPLHHATLAWTRACGPVHQKALAESVSVDPGDLVKHLDALQGRGLLDRQRDPQDRRRQLVTITAAGEDLLRHADDQLAEAEQHCFNGIAPDVQAQLREILTTIYRDVNGHTPPEPIDSFEVIEGRSALRAAAETRSD